MSMAALSFAIACSAAAVLARQSRRRQPAASGEPASASGEPAAASGEPAAASEEPGHVAAARRRCIASALGARKHAAAKHSHYRVGAALLTTTGTIFTGVNVESDSYGLAFCGERCALVKALSEGARSFAMLAIATRDGGISCGACRQLLAEYCPASMHVIFVDEGGEVVVERTVGQMLPEPFVLNQ